MLRRPCAQAATGGDRRRVADDQDPHGPGRRRRRGGDGRRRRVGVGCRRRGRSCGSTAQGRRRGDGDRFQRRERSDRRRHDRRLRRVGDASSSRRRRRARPRRRRARRPPPSPRRAASASARHVAWRTGCSSSDVRGEGDDGGDGEAEGEQGDPVEPGARRVEHDVHRPVEQVQPVADGADGDERPQPEQPAGRRRAAQGEQHRGADQADHGEAAAVGEAVVGGQHDAERAEGEQTGRRQPGRHPLQATAVVQHGGGGAGEDLRRPRWRRPVGGVGSPGHRDQRRADDRHSAAATIGTTRPLARRRVRRTASSNSSGHNQ